MQVAKDEIAAKLEQVIQAAPRGPKEAERASRAAALLADYLRLAERVADLAEEKTSLEEWDGAGFDRLTLHEAALQILREAGRPMHARELGDRIKARGWRHRRSKVARPDQIVYQLAARLPKYPNLFRRVAPNTFALAEWGERKPQANRSPRLGLFKGSRAATARKIGDSDEALADQSWRSS
jgi:hypothetical protein